MTQLDHAVSATVDETIAEADRPCFLIHLSEAQARDLVAGIVPPELVKDCEDFLVWCDEGIKAGVKRMRENAKKAKGGQIDGRRR
jgi:hypothetical protein